MTQDLYSILGVSKDASDAELKKQYRKLSLQYHPDRQTGKTDAEKKEAEEKMAQVNLAWSILGDSQKRQQYDSGMIDENGNQKGFNPFGDGSPFGDVDFDFGDIFGSMFGGGRRGSRGRAQERVVPGQDLQIRIKIGIDELFVPKEHKIRYKKDVRCRVCHGAGGSGEHDCPVCHGTGLVTETSHQGFAMVQQTRVCPRCNGSGKVVDKSCEHCHGTGFEKKEFDKTIIFPQGVQDGQFIVYENEGSEAKKTGHPNGRLIVIAQYDFDKEKYTVDGADVTEKILVDYADCLLGKKLEHIFPDGSKMNISIPKLTPPGKKLMMRGRGLQVTDNFGRTITGNYILEICYRLPDTLSNDEKLALQDIRDFHTTEKENS